MMLETAAYVGASLFFSVLLLFFYRTYTKKRRTNVVPIDVPLRAERTSLLEKQRQIVSERRNRLKNISVPKAKNQDKPTPSSKLDSQSEESTEAGFGEDLGAAVSLNSEQASPTSVKTIRSSGRSRFAALQEAADQFKEIYNRNSQL